MRRRVVATWVNRAITRVDDTPTALGADLAHGRTRVWHLVTGPERMGCRVKTVRRGDRTDFDRFKEDIVTGISGH